MRFVRFSDESGNARIGELVDDEISFAGKRYDIDEVEILPPSEPTKIVAGGANFHSHIEAMGGEVPEIPRLHVQTPNTVTKHEGVVNAPAGEDIQPEAEIGVLIDSQCRNVSSEEAMDYVSGYTCVNDITNRSGQRGEKIGRRDMIRGKAFDNATPIGPVLSTPDEIPDDARVQLRVNGEVKQDYRIDDMIYGIEELIAETSSILTLEPGDVLAPGTSGSTPNLDDGDLVEVEVEGVGTLENEVRLV